MKCEECLGESNYEICENCCDHSDIDHNDRVCLICGKDMIEDFVASVEAAYDLENDR